MLTGMYCLHRALARRAGSTYWVSPSPCSHDPRKQQGVRGCHKEAHHHQHNWHLSGKAQGSTTQDQSTIRPVGEQRQGLLEACSDTGAWGLGQSATLRVMAADAEAARHWEPTVSSVSSSTATCTVLAPSETPWLHSLGVRAPRNCTMVADHPLTRSRNPAGDQRAVPSAPLSGAAPAEVAACMAFTPKPSTLKLKP